MALSEEEKQELAQAVLDTPLDEFTIRPDVNAAFANYVGVVSSNADSADSAAQLSITTSTNTGDVPTWISYGDLTAPPANPIRYTLHRGPTWVGDPGTFRIDPMPFIPEPFVLQPPDTPPETAIEELMRSVIRQTQRSQNPPAQSEEPLSEMIKAIHTYPSGDTVILVNGPKAASHEPISPELIARLDRELKAAIIRAFDLVIDARKLPEFKRTLIMD